ncbi:MAG: hypothetical protein JHC71_13330 [Blastococcus sp.]|nr:hypothetical protein [Blastococcus sp.]
MNALALVLLGLTGVAGLALVLMGRPGPQVRGAAMATLLAADTELGIATVLAVFASVAGGGPVATGVLHAADPAAVGVVGGAQDPEILRGGAWIGVLERAALTATLLAGWPEGLAVILAVKGLGRFAELRSPAAAERFIVGTLASALWAAACAGLVLLLRV